MFSRRGRFRCVAGVLALGVAAAAAAQEAPSAAPPDARGTRPNLLIVTLDTTRRDFLGCYGHAPSVTPHLDCLAAECTVFEDAYTVAPLTLPAHSSLMTGRYPAALGVRVNTLTKLPEEATTLAELLGTAGYHTAAVVSAFVLDPSFGIAQGFERYHAPPLGILEASGGMAERPAAASVDLALEELEHLEAPWFLWLHLFDPHFPYAPPDLGMGVEEQDPGNREQRYAAEIRYADEHLGRLFTALQDRGLWDALVLVFAADHGESMGDTPETSHGHFLYDPTTRIPLLLRAPGLSPGRCGGTVSLVDVVPTTLALLGVAPAGVDLDGVSLVPLVRGAAPLDRALALESYEGYVSYGWAPFEGLVQGPYKFIHSHHDELYDRFSDPAESTNLVEQDPRRAQALRQRVEEIFSAPPALASEVVALGEEERQALAQLGYVEAGGGVLGSRPAMEELPDATQKAAVLRQMDAATFAFLHGHAPEGLELLREICRQEPQSAGFHERLGMALLRYQPERLDEAEAVLRQAAGLVPGSAPTHYCLGWIAGQRYRQGAREAEALARQGDESGGERLWQEAREQRRQALEEFETTLGLEPTRVEALRGIALLEQDRAEEAERGGNRERALRLYEESLERATRYLELLPAEHPQRAGFENLRSYLRTRIAALQGD